MKLERGVLKVLYFNSIEDWGNRGPRVGRLLKKELYSSLRNRGLLLSLFLLFIISSVSTAKSFGNTASFNDENLSRLSIAYGYRAKTIDEFNSWYQTEHFRDFIFRKSFENNAFTPLAAGLVLGIFFFGLPDYKRESSVSICAGISRRRYLGTKLLCYLALNLAVTNLPMLALFTFRIPHWITYLPDYAPRDVMLWLLYQLGTAMSFCLIMLLTRSIFKNVAIGLLYCVLCFVAAIGTWIIGGVNYHSIWYTVPLFCFCPAFLSPAGQMGSILFGMDALPVNSLLATCTYGASIVFFTALAFLIWGRRDLQ